MSEDIYNFNFDISEEADITEPKKVEEETLPPLETVPDVPKLNSGALRRSSRERAAYEKMETVEREQLALDKLNSRELLDTVLPRFYQAYDNKDITDLSDYEKIELYMTDWIGKYHNTGKAALDVYGVTYGDMSKDNEYRADWAELSQLYNDLPSFGKDTVGLAKWLLNFVPEVTVQDPTFWLTAGFGALATKYGKGQAIDKAVKTITEKIATEQAKAKTGSKVIKSLSDDEVLEYINKRELRHQVLMKTLKYSAITDGLFGIGVGGIYDTASQFHEIEAGLKNDFDTYRLLKTGVMAGSINAVTSGVFTGLSMKGNIGRYFEDPETGFLRDVQRELGIFDSQNNPTYSVNKKGQIEMTEPEKRLELGLGDTVQTKNKEQGTITNFSKDGKRATVKFTGEDGKTKTKVISKNNLDLLSKPEGSLDPNVLPPYLAGAKPRYNYGRRPIDLEFEDDITKALYIVGGKGESARHADYLAFLDNAGVKNIAEEAAKVRKFIRDEAAKGNDFVKVKGKYKQVKQEIVKPDETPIIIKKSEEINRKTDFVNYDKIDASNDFKLKVKEIMTALGKQGVLRTQERAGLLKFLKERGYELQAEKVDEVFNKLEYLSKLGDEAGANKFAAELEVLARIHNMKTYDDLIEEAVTPAEKEGLANALRKEMDEIGEKAKISTGASTAASDILQSGKLSKSLDLAKQHQLEATEAFVYAYNELAKSFDTMTFEQIIESITKLRDHLNNPFKLEKLVNDAKLKAKKDQVSLGQAVNELITGNLLLDPTTHILNISSATAKYGTLRVEDYFASLIHLGRTTIMDGSPDLDLYRMLKDVDTTQGFLWNTAYREASMAYKLQRNVGDALEHKFDNPRMRMMEAYAKQAELTNNALKQTAAGVGSAYNKVSSQAFKLLGFEDTFIKALVNRAYRIAQVNHRMRKFYPDLWKSQKNKKAEKYLKESEAIKSNQKDIWYEEAKPKPDTKKIQRLQAEIHELEKKIDNGEFAKKYRELYYQYEDEFGNWRMTRDFDESEVATLDNLTKSVAYDPTFVARETTFTNNPRRETLDPNQFFPDQEQSKLNIGAWIIEKAQSLGWTRIALGLHYMKTPNNLFKDAIQRTPALHVLSAEWWSLMFSSDPLVRQKALAANALAYTVFGSMYYFTDNENFIGGDHPDPQRRYTFKYNAYGKDYLIDFKRYTNLMPMLVAADTHKTVEKRLQNMQLDDTITGEKSLLVQAIDQYARESVTFYSHLMSNQLYFRETTEIMKIITDPEGIPASQWERYKGGMLAKSVPAATFSRFTNRAMAEAQYEMNSIWDYLSASTPYETIKYINEELLDSPIAETDYAFLSAPKRDMLHNKMPPKNFISPIQTPEALSGYMFDRNGELLQFSEPSKTRLLDSALTSNYTPMAYTYRLKGTGKLADPLDLKGIEVVKLTLEDGDYHSFVGEVELPEHASLYETMRIVAGSIVHSEYDDRTLNETIHYEVSNPYSDYNTLYRENRLIGGSYEGGEYLRTIIRDYEEAARNHIKEYATFNYGGNVRTILDIEEEIEEKQELIIRQ